MNRPIRTATDPKSGGRSATAIIATLMLALVLTTMASHALVSPPPDPASAALAQPTVSPEATVGPEPTVPPEPTIPPGRLYLPLALKNARRTWRVYLPVVWQASATAR